MKILFIISCLILSSCTYNIDGSVRGNYTNTVTGNTVKGVAPASQPTTIINTYAPYWTFPYYRGFYGGFPWTSGWGGGGWQWNGAYRYPCW